MDPTLDRRIMQQQQQQQQPTPLQLMQQKLQEEAMREEVLAQQNYQNVPDPLHQPQQPQMIGGRGPRTRSYDDSLNHRGRQRQVGSNWVSYVM